ncbi:hypothetical protein [Methylocystis heyeri]|uniref:Uncharacterized protein n=1 Tax=Methylocystis heyeri TaxID=391905 RepID=A0A6B8KCY1_9HYPH|nr:hypothetical protein [Methylocystis heyeri]QGM46274.1 hypothetical protein H2LOC_011505 [Methylocystis heyeri]
MGLDPNGGNIVSLGIHGYQTATGIGWSNTAIGIGMDVDSTTRSGANIWLNANGYVGIGTASPTSLLHLSSGIGIPIIQLDAGSGEVAQIGRASAFLYPGGNTDLGINAPAGQRLMLGVAGTPDLTILNGGNIGIGTTSPGSSLQVNGGAAIGYSTNTAAPSNGMLVSGQIGVGKASPAADVKADINGAAKVAGTGSETCASATAIGKFRYNASKGYFEICSP